MKATLEFDLPQESVEHYEAVNGTAFRVALQGVDERLRMWLKHGHEFESADGALEACRKLIDLEMREGAVSLY